MEANAKKTQLIPIRLAKLVYILGFVLAFWAAYKGDILAYLGGHYCEAENADEFVQLSGGGKYRSSVVSNQWNYVVENHSYHLITTDPKLQDSPSHRIYYRKGNPEEAYLYTVWELIFMELWLFLGYSIVWAISCYFFYDIPHRFLKS